jgi:SdpC family antimicrobial peptide
MYRNQRTRIAFAIALAIALVVGTNAAPAALARSDSGGSTSSTPAAAMFDGRTLFSAIFFATGPAAALLPARAFPAPTADQARTIVDGINAADPSFFKKFADDVRTGDRVVIREALNNAARLLEQVIQGSFETTLDCDPSVDPTCDPSLGIVLALRVDIAIVAVVAADFVRVVDFYRDYNIYYQYDLWRTEYFYKAVLMDQASQLASDAFIDAVAKAFGA